jgi:type II secretory pathway pseudopilin PulG
MRVKSRKNYGQSLIEIVIALAIIGIILIGLVRTVTLSLKNLEYSTNKNLALNLAQAKMEEIRKERDSQNWIKFWDDHRIPDGGEIDIPPEYFKKDGTLTTATEGIFTRGVRFWDKSGTTPKEKVEVVVWVSWSDALRIHYATISGYLTGWD